MVEKIVASGTENWRPNWKNPSEYPDPEQMTPDMWAWEFLRRSKKYQEDFVALQSRLDDIGYEHAQNIYIYSVESSESEETDAKNIITIARGICGHFYKKYKIFPTNPALSCYDTFARFGEKGRVGIYRHPDENSYDAPLDCGGYEGTAFSFAADSNLDQFPLMDRDVCMENKSLEIKLLSKPMNLLVEIDLKESIPEQLKLIEMIARKRQKQLRAWEIYKPVRSSKEHYQDYLRCLDALEAGVDKSTMIELLLPNCPNSDPDYNANKTLNNWINKGAEIRDGGYLELTRQVSI